LTRKRKRSDFADPANFLANLKISQVNEFVSPTIVEIPVKKSSFLSSGTTKVQTFSGSDLYQFKMLWFLAIKVKLQLGHSISASGGRSNLAPARRPNVEDVFAPNSICCGMYFR
jgi:hypothetical protein